MKISCNWLKDYVDLKASPERLAELLTMAGLTVESLRKEGSDAILETEVTANRPDWLSYIGVAREVAALTGGKLKVPTAKKILAARGGKSAISIKVEEKALCPRYTARIIRGVKVGDSPQWLKTKLEAMGLRPVNNVVDITNFCLFETGEPMHAFDLDKIEGALVVRNARQGEKIVTIDGVERTLDAATLVIADSRKPIALAGVMGGANTEVNCSTENILLEAAYFDPVSIRRTVRKLAISTESSYRFERKVDVPNIAAFSDRACGLICEAAGGSAGKFIDMGSKGGAAKEAGLEYSRCGKILGVEVAPARIRKILASLGLKIKRDSRGRLKLGIPPFRQDLHDEIDLIEEIARVYGYGNIPDTVPAIVEQDPKVPCEMVVDKKIRRTLTGLGMDEIITYSLLGKDSLSAAGLLAENIVDVRNPLTSEQEAMRPSLALGMLNSMAWNMNRKSNDLRLFELGRIYSKAGVNKFVEDRCVSLALAGGISNWAVEARGVDFFDLKGIVETLFAELGIREFSFEFASNSLLSPRSSAAIKVGEKYVGTIGEASRKALDYFEIKEAVYLCQISIDSISKYIRMETGFKDIPKFPSVFRDISVVVPRLALNSTITASIRAAAGPALKDVRLIDRYIGKQIPGDKVGLTYRIEYQDPARTLEERDISGLHASILHELETKHSARLR